jgi:hypothetical protein
VNFGRRNYTPSVPRLPYFVLTINVPGDFVNPCSTDDANPAPANIFEYSANV